MRVLIFGASSFIGKSLIKHAESSGYEVIAFCRSGHIPGFKGKCIKWQFGSEIDGAFKGANFAIHLAHDFGGPNGAQITTMETEKNILKLKSLGISRQLYFSSYSAGPHALSLYGRAKYHTEKLISAFDDVMIIRPGLVIGNGGIYGRISRWANILPIIPLPNGGVGLVPVIELDKLCKEVLSILISVHGTKEFNLFEAKMLSLKDLVLRTTAIKSKKPVILNVPSVMFSIVLAITKMIGIPMPINIDNIKGFLANQKAMHESYFLEEFK
jgi:nucleoside-diphosphate-sugar epimerase